MLAISFNKYYIIRLKHLVLIAFINFFFITNAQKGTILAVVEVKTRSSLEFGLPQEFVKPKKIQLLVKAINEYVTQKDLDTEVRFDIIAIHKENSEFVIEHIEDAFYFF